MSRVIGAADEFWRLRLTRVSTTDDLDFEWHDDILYRKPVVTMADEIESWNIEAVQLSDFDSIVVIGSFRDRGRADAFLDKAREDLSEMTKSQFEDAYLTPIAPEDAAPSDETAEAW